MLEFQNVSEHVADFSEKRHSLIRSPGFAIDWHEQNMDWQIFVFFWLTKITSTWVKQPKEHGGVAEWEDKKSAAGNEEMRWGVIEIG